MAISRQVRLVRRLFFGRAAGAAICFALGQDPNRGFVFEFPEKIVGDGLDKFALDGAIAPASSSQSLENPHRVLR
jgi:hypothetical protein